MESEAGSFRGVRILTEHGALRPDLSSGYPAPGDDCSGSEPLYPLDLLLLPRILFTMFDFLL